MAGGAAASRGASSSTTRTTSPAWLPGRWSPGRPSPTRFLDVDPYLFLNPSRVDVEEVGPGVQQRFRLGDVTFDRQNGLLYLLELYADEARPVVHVFRVR